MNEALRPFGTSIFSEMTALAQQHGAINLAQGFPDFEGPADIVEAAVDALRAGHNQYARGMGLPALTEAIADRQEACYGLRYDPATEVTVTNGATEGIAVALLGLLNPGDEVILFEPFYDSYPACVALGGGIARYYTLRFPDFALDPDRLAALFTERTRVLLLNSPHNPTGKVFSRAELELIAELCQRHDVTVVTDEVYEHLVYDADHVPIATLPGMRERTLRISSAAKTYSFTGWKIGWLTGPAPLLAAAQAAHQFTSYSSAHPLQHAMAYALRTHGAAFLAALRTEYLERRNLLADILARSGFEVSLPQGTYFILTSYRGLSDADDRAFARELTQRHGVSAIPPRSFYAAEPHAAHGLLRFAFCKAISTLRAAEERLAALAKPGPAQPL